MAKIIDSVCGFYEDAECLDISLLDSKPYYLVKLGKQHNISKDIYIGNRWSVHENVGLYTCGTYWYWKPLEFNRGIVYA